MDVECTLSFWNVFFDSLYLYPDNPSIEVKKQYENFFNCYGNHSPFPIINKLYKEQLKHNKLKLSNKNELIKWGVDQYNNIQKKLIDEKNDDNYYCMKDDVLYKNITYEDVYEWMNKQLNGIPKKIYNKPHFRVRKSDKKRGYSYKFTKKSILILVLVVSTISFISGALICYMFLRKKKKPNLE